MLNAKEVMKTVRFHQTSVWQPGEI